MTVGELMSQLSKYWNEDEEVMVAINVDEGYVTLDVVSVDTVNSSDAGIFINLYGLTADQIEKAMED